MGRLMGASGHGVCCAMELLIPPQEIAALMVRRGFGALGALARFWTLVVTLADTDLAIAMTPSSLWLEPLSVLVVLAGARSSSTSNRTFAHDRGAIRSVVLFV
jgi:hypothetical protein